MTDPAPTWNTIPLVTARGSTPEEIGFAHGSQIPRRIARCKETYEALFLETASITWAEAVRRARLYLPTIERHEPDLLAEMKGIARGTGGMVDFEDVLVLNLRSEIVLTNYSDGCTSLAHRGESGGDVYVAQNWDWVGEAAGNITVFDITRTTAAAAGNGSSRRRSLHVRMVGEAGIVGKFGMNEAGVGICLNAMRCGVVSMEQCPVHLALRRCLEECRSTAEVVRFLEERGVAQSVNIMVGDKSGDIVSLECTPRGIAQIRPREGQRTIAHTNHLFAEGLPAGIKDHPPSDSLSRLDRIRVLAAGDDKKGHEAVDAARIRSWLSDKQGEPTSICRAPPPGAVGVERMETLVTIIMDLGRGTGEVSFGKPSSGPPVMAIGF